MYKKYLLLLLLFCFCSENPPPFLSNSQLPAGNWKVCAWSKFTGPDTIPWLNIVWQNIVVSCDSITYTQPSAYNIFIKDNSLIKYTCSNTVTCSDSWELSPMNDSWVTLKAPNGLGGYQYELWYWRLYSDTLTTSVDIGNSETAKYKFIKIADSIVCN